MAILFDSISIDLTLFFTVILTTIYFYFKHSFGYFQRKNIPYLKSSFPLGNTNLSFFHKYGQELKVLYDEFKNKRAKFGGFYIVTKPVVLLLDPDVIKQILTKDFQYFSHRGIYHNEEREFITSHLFNLEVSQWRTLRNKFTPIFSTSKLKNMVEVILEKTKSLEEKLQELSSTCNSFEAKDLCTRITTDMFCSVGFGIECNSLTDPNAEFPKYAQILVNNNLYHTIKLMVGTTLPNLFTKLNIYYFKLEFQTFFIKTITDVVAYRETNSIERPDFMNLLIKLKTDAAITMKQLIAQCFVFFLGGFETSAAALIYCLFELTKNQDLQNTLREEIRFVLEKHGGVLSYEAIMEMQLLDKVIAETLRKYPPVVVLNRECMEEYTIPGTKSVIEKGTSVMVPVLGLHHDPEIYPDPDKFDPERFSTEEKAKRHPYSYLPFGEGPRNCIGLRLGQLQVKIGIIYMLKNYKYTLNNKTKLPIEFKTVMVLLASESDIWIDVSKI